MMTKIKKEIITKRKLKEHKKKRKKQKMKK